MPNYDFHCNSCRHKFIEQVKYEDRDTPGAVSCPKCNTSEVTRHFPAPMPMRASFPDGHKRPGWAELRAAVKLKRQMLQEKGLAGDPRKKIELLHEMHQESRKAMEHANKKLESRGGYEGVEDKLSTDKSGD